MDKVARLSSKNFAFVSIFLSLSENFFSKKALQSLIYPLRVWGIILNCMKNCVDYEKVVKRLKRVQGQIGGIIKMIESEKDCEDVLIQIGAAKAALHKTGQSVLEGHLHHCVLDAIKQGHGEEALDHLSDAIGQFLKI